MLTAERETTLRKLLDAGGEPAAEDAAALLGELDRLRGESAAAGAAYARLSEEFQAEAADCLRLRGALAASESALATYRQRCEELWRELQAERDAAERAAQQRGRVGDAALAAADECVRLRAALTEALRGADDNAKQAVFQRERREAAEAECERLRYEAGRLKRLNEGLCERTAAAHDVLAAAAERDGLAGECARLRGECEKLRDELACARQRAAFAEGELESARERLRRLADEARRVGA